VGLEAAIL